MSRKSPESATNNEKKPVCVPKAPGSIRKIYFSRLLKYHADQQKMKVLKIDDTSSKKIISKGCGTCIMRADPTSIFVRKLELGGIC